MTGTDARAWLHTIALRLAFNRLRRRRLWDRWLPGERRDPVWIMPERLDLWRALADLRPQARAAMFLNVVDGYTQAEIGQMLEAPEETVASWVSEAKRQLRGRGWSAMTGDDRLHDELEALERSAPADLPPRPSAPRPRWWRRLAAPATVVVAAVLVTVVVAPELIDAIRPLNSPHATDSGAATVSDPPAPRTGAAAEITFVGRWADCCYIEAAVTFASLSGGPTSRRDEEIAGIETWQIRPGSYELTLYHRPCDASCDALDPVAGTCTTDLTIEPSEAILVSVTWHIGGPCETSLTPRPPPPNDPSSVRGTLAIDGSCVIVTDEYAYRWAIRLPDGYRVHRTSGWATVLFGPDGRIAAMGGDTVTFEGHQTDALDIGCTTGMPYVAASMDVDAAPLVWQAVSCEPPPVGAPVALACDRAISAAIGAWQGDRTTITYFEFHYGGYCPIGARCAFTPKRFDIGWVMLRTEVRADGSEKDVFLSVVADDGGAIRVTSIDPPTAT